MAACLRAGIHALNYVSSAKSQTGREQGDCCCHTLMSAKKTLAASISTMRTMVKVNPLS